MPTLRRVLVTAHNLGVMERLRDLPALRALIEEARSFERWRDIRTYLAIIGEYSPAFSTEQKGLALDFFLELLEHRDDDIRYQAAARIGELLASKEDFWRKDLPAGVVLRQERTVLDELERVLALLDRAPARRRRTWRRWSGCCTPSRSSSSASSPRPTRAAPAGVAAHQAGLRDRRRDRRPLVGLYVCEALEIAAPLLPPEERRELISFVRAFMTHDITNTRLMAWRLLLALAREAGSDPELLGLVKECVEALASRVSGRSLPAELYLVEELAWICDLVGVAQRCKELRKAERDPVREVFLRNLKSHIGWVEKKVNCDYLTTVVRRRLQENRDPGAYFAHEVASHFGNMLKVSRVEGTRFHAGRCLLELLPVLHVTQRNEVTIELLRSLELDAEAITRYIPRFLGSVLASLPDQEFAEVLADIEASLQRGTEGLQRLLLQTVCWVLLSIEVGRLEGKLLRRLVGMLLGALAESAHRHVQRGLRPARDGARAPVHARRTTGACRASATGVQEALLAHHPPTRRPRALLPGRLGPQPPAARRGALAARGEVCRAPFGGAHPGHLRPVHPRPRDDRRQGAGVRRRGARADGRLLLAQARAAAQPARGAGVDGTGRHTGGVPGAVLAPGQPGEPGGPAGSCSGGSASGACSWLSARTCWRGRAPTRVPRARSGTCRTSSWCARAPRRPGGSSASAGSGGASRWSWRRRPSRRSRRRRCARLSTGTPSWSRSATRWSPAPSRSGGSTSTTRPTRSRCHLRPSATRCAPATPSCRPS